MPTPTLLPYQVQASGTDEQKVSMTVQSLFSNGEVSCQIMYKDIIIRNEASGNKPTVTCEGTPVL